MDNKVYKKITEYNGFAAVGVKKFIDMYMNLSIHMQNIDGDNRGSDGAFGWLKVYNNLDVWTIGCVELLESEYGDVESNRFIGVFKKRKNCIIDRKTGKEVYSIYLM